MLVEKFLIILLGGVVGTLLRYGLCSNIKNKYFDGLFISNVIGIGYALIMVGTTPLLVLSFSGSLTSFSSFIKNSYKNMSYMILHVFFYILLCIFLFIYI